ncbi:MAG: TerC family protein [Actinomycetaceae bacterium]|nr:TerC family protein [Actinomycetaceae bacterium]MDU0969541.1 TerC family protein [Actinomycetaceae bacterium]
MHVHAAGWIGLTVVIIALLTIDFVGHVRSPHEPSLKEASRWSAAYICLAVLYGFGIWAIWGIHYAGEYWAGWVTEWSLSLDNLFVFIIIIGAFRVPRKYQQEVLLGGIIFALIFRLIFILIGATLINRFAWIFYLFGLFLIYTAISQARTPLEEDEEYKENGFTRLVRRVFPMTDGFVGGRLLVRHRGKTFITPMLVVMVALASADIMFAFDSIPAIFGLTREPFIVFSATVFSLLGLRQLYFLIDGLLEKLVFLNYGLALILGFIGIKLIIHAIAENNLPFINGGQPVEGMWEPSIVVSLAYILVVLIGTTVVSVLWSRRHPEEAQAIEDQPGEAVADD